jgi:hypothetical protein
MRKNNYIKSIVLALGSLFAISTLANAQDSTFKPSGKLWGQVFSDYFYKAHSDSLGRGFGQYANGGLAPNAGIYPQSMNQFQFRRIYLGYNYDFAPKVSAELLLAAENDIANKDVNAGGSFSPYIKYADVRLKKIYPGADLVIGQFATPAFAQSSEPVWGYRSVEKTITDFHGTPSYDMGVAVQGYFDVKTAADAKTANYGYNVMIGNGTKAVPATNSYKWFYGDIWAKFLNKKLIVDLYADYNELKRLPATATASTVNQSRNMIKLVVGYTVPKLSVGAEAFINTFHDQLTAIETVGAKKDTLSPAAEGISLFARGPIVKGKLGFFARYDMVNPNNLINNTKYSSYTALAGTTVGSYATGAAGVGTEFYKEQFITAGLDFTPGKDIHIMPNIWYNQFASQLAKPVGSAKSDYDLVYRVTFSYVFGK